MSARYVGIGVGECHIVLDVSTQPGGLGMIGPEYEVEAVLRDGTRMRIRAVRPDDKRQLADLFQRLSPTTIYYRFHGAKRRLTSQELVYLTELDFRRQAALAAVLRIDGEDRIVGVARYAAGPEDVAGRAEMAVTVEDAHQGRGIGRLLLEQLARLAAGAGITKLDAYVLPDNDRTIRLFERSGRIQSRGAARGACHFVLSTESEPGTGSSET